MTKDVLISIIGMHIDIVNEGETGNEPVEVITPASYFFKNGKHYIVYDEMAEGLSGVTKNKVKITGNEKLEIIKSGIINAHMVFEKGKKYHTNYETPYGQFAMGFYTKDLKITEEEEKISIRVNYNLELNDEIITVCTIQITVQPKEKGIDL